MANAEKLVLPDDEHGVTGERMEGIGDARLEGQTPGIMCLPRMREANAPPFSIR
jgi:hypothetical protein